MTTGSLDGARPLRIDARSRRAILERKRPPFAAPADEGRGDEGEISEGGDDDGAE